MSASLTRWSGLSSVAFGLLVAASAVVRLVGGDSVVAAWLGFAGATFGVAGLVGLYGTLERTGPAGVVAFGIGLVGLALSLGQLYGLTFNAPRTGPLGPLFPLGYGPFLFGLLTLDALIIWKRLLGPLAAGLMVLGAVLNAAGFATVEIRLLGVVVFGAGVAWLGLSLVRSTEAGELATEAAA